MLKTWILTFSCICGLFITAGAQNLYFPSTANDNNWDTLSPASLGWCTDQVDSLYDYLDQEQTKGFLVLKDGRIVLEKYFGTFTKDSLWYWASAGKTITAFLIGKAQEEGFLSIQDSSSHYLGAGWTNCTAQQEGSITIRNQLTMTTGLDDGVPDNHCTLDTCLDYLADPGTRWAYHNAPYTLLEQVLSNATGLSANNYTLTRLKNQTGMNGIWFTSDYDNVFFSTVRSMARFGLLAQNHFIWNNDTLLHDTAYVNQLTNTSQNLNNSYGYLWWLNGKSSFMVPTLQTVFPGSYAPHAPDDMFAGIGKNGQLVSISRSKGIVFIRMGNQSSGNEVPFTLADHIWEKLNAIMCSTSTIDEQSKADHMDVFPNPASETISVKVTVPEDDYLQLELYDLQGRLLISKQYSKTTQEPEILAFPTRNIAIGSYLFRIRNSRINLAKHVQIMH
jgi:CubicO group peptidase (beta-lactamase class C family)